MAWTVKSHHQCPAVQVIECVGNAYDYFIYPYVFILREQVSDGVHRRPPGSKTVLKSDTADLVISLTRRNITHFNNLLKHGERRICKTWFPPVSWYYSWIMVQYSHTFTVSETNRSLLPTMLINTSRIIENTSLNIRLISRFISENLVASVSTVYT